MLQKVLILVVVAAIGVFCLSGCKKSSSEAESEEEQVKTMAEYEDEARKQINKENMAQELENIEKAVEEEISQEQ